LAEFEALVRAPAMRLSSRVLIDFIPNHVGADLPFLDFAPDFETSGNGDDTTTRFFARDNSFFYLGRSPGDERQVITRPATLESARASRFDGLVPTEDGARPVARRRRPGDNSTSPESRRE